MEKIEKPFEDCDEVLQNSGDTVGVSTTESLRQICEIQKEMMSMIMSSIMEPNLKKQSNDDQVNLAEISQLINIRDYVATAINNFSLNKTIVKDLSKLLALVDKRVSDKLVSEEFKEYIGFKDAAKVMAEVIDSNNIKRGMNPSDSVIMMNAHSAHTIK